LKIARLAVALAALWLAGCAGTKPATPPTAATKDLVTASDQPTATKRANVRLELATAYFAQGQLSTALDEVKLAISADPNMSEAFNLRGLIYAALGEDALAQESFRRALQLNAHDADVMHNYGWYLCQQKHYAEANALFEQALAEPRYGDVARTMLAQGLCQLRAGDLAQAERTLTRAFQLDSSNPATAFNLADVLYRRGDYERARFYIRRVNASKDQINAQSLWLAARIEYRSGNTQGATELGAQLRNRYPQSKEAQAFEQGRFDD
jgi:type IV pilus assembly protein PilF